jgi:two-component system, cell cycle sensor histidine kinase and response regulator CckA
MYEPLSRKGSTVAAGAAFLLVLLDIARLAILPLSHQNTFTDGFESAVALLCAISCVFAARRSSPMGKGLWSMATIFFVLLAAADTHDFLQDMSLMPGALSPAFQFLGWCVYPALALLVFFPIEKDGRPDWTWLPALDFLLVAVATALAYYRLIYLPHSVAGIPWTVRGNPELVRNIAISGGLLLRSAVDPSSRARAFYRRLGGVFAGVTFLQCFSPVYDDHLYLVGRPALWMVLGILAASWENIPEASSEQVRRRSALRIVLSLCAAATLILVAVLALGSAAPYCGLMDVSVGVAAALFILRSALAERSRLAAETQMRRSERDYRVLFESAVVPIVIFEPGSERILQANNAACELYGVAPGSLVGASLRDFTKDIARGEEQIAELLLSGTCRTFESVHRTRNGKEINVVVSSSIIRYHGRKAILSFNRDVTERKRAEEALLRLRQAVDSSGEVVFMTDQEGVITFINRAFTETYGYKSEDVVGKTTPRILKSGRVGPEAYQEFWKMLLKKRSVQGEFVNKTKDGRSLTVDASVSAILDPSGNISGFLAIQRDVTERKRAEAALRESEDRYRDLVEHSQDLICIHDLEGRLLSINPSPAKILGYSREEMVGMPMREFLVPEVRGQFEAYLERIRRNGEDAGLLRVRTRDGKERIWEYNNSLRTEGLPQPIVRGLAHDITERLEAKKALKKAEEQFLQAQKMDAVGRLAGGVAHDFNNLLTVINGYSDLLLESVPPDSPQRSPLEEIKRAGDRAAALNRQLLTFSRKQIFMPTVLDLNAIVEGMRKMLRRLIGEDIEFVARPGKPLGRIKADSGQVEQVIMNLAVNARDAMPKGGKLTIETANVELDQEYARVYPFVTPGKYVLLALSDTGYGMDAETQSHIFEPFFTTKERGKGTGLGLSTVYGIVKQSGGHVNVYSEVGHGTIFKVYFPRIDAPVEVDSKKNGAAAQVTGTETVLLVEDEPSVCSLAVQALRTNGYTVLAAANSEEALQLSARHPEVIHLLLTDVIMPGRNGRELAESLKGLRPEMKVLFISGYTADAIAQHGILEEGVSFLPKPFTPRDLLAKLRQTLDG